jgi:hypothetical protein
MLLRPQDVVVALVIALRPNERWSFPAIARAACLSLSEAHAATKRASQARLLTQSPDGSGAIIAMRENLLELLVHGLKYAFPPERGGVTRGVPTAHSANVFAGRIAATGNDALVWPYAKGSTRGESLAPLYKTAPQAALNDPKLYDALALVDAIRIGNARERGLAVKMLEALFLSKKR